MKILWATTELRPFAMAGGLSDVSFALPLAISKLNHDIRLIIPYYSFMKSKIEQSVFVYSYKDYENKSISIFKIEYEGLMIYLVDHELFEVNQIYEESGLSARITLFSWIVSTFFDKIDWQPEIIHAHDWVTGPLMAFISERRERLQDFDLPRLVTIFTIHNLAYQGNVPVDEISKTSLDPKYFNNLIDLGKVDFVRYLRLGIAWSDKITTVSETYASEILTPEYGYGLEIDLNKHPKKIVGITHGIDTNEWNPRSDKHIHPYSLIDINSKLANKLELQKLGNLKNDKDVFTIGLVSRLVYQKGLDLVAEIIPMLKNYKIQIFVLGTGETEIENKLILLQKQFPDNFGLFLQFNTKLSHQFFAGLDAFLVPSRYEPCGLTQLYAMRYGTLPIVRLTGGLVDTVSEKYDFQTGFTFSNYDKDEFIDAVLRAYDCYTNNQDRWIEIQMNCLSQDLSWSKPARKWESEYLNLLRSV